MFVLGFAVLALAWKTTAQDNDGYHPHAAFAFIRTGERTPTIRPGPPVLTALGAQQMYQLGQKFRTRYISGDNAQGFGIQHIQGLSTDVLDNNQVLVHTLDTSYLVSSSQAFMQGLYPPHSILNGSGDATGLLANGSAIEYPLGGYQYASIQAMGTLDPQSIHLQGDQNCPFALRDAMMWFSTDQYQELKTTSDELYKKLDLDWSEASLDELNDEFTTYTIKRFDYLSYKYSHDREVHQALTNNTSYTGIYDTLHHIADEEAWHLWGNFSRSSNATSMRVMPGKTLATAILTQFQKIVIDHLSPRDKIGNSYPLTFFFGEMEPFISLISLMMLDKRNQQFRSMPAFGSAMLFELFSTGTNSSFPDSQNDLWVRFYYYNGTAYPDQLMPYPLFGNGPSKTDIPWLEFQTAFQEIMVESLKEWCESCASPSLFCWGVNTRVRFVSSTEEHKPKLSSTVAGVIGAMVALAVAGLLFGLAALFGGVRLHRVQQARKSELGGFKGAAKLASDPDLTSVKGGAPPTAGIVSCGDGNKKGHERVGSWELRQKEIGSGDLGDRSPRVSFDAIDAVAVKPVQPHEGV